MNEQEYLAHQAKEARRAISDAARRLSDHIGKGVNPLHWTRDFPKTAIGIAALAGALAANAVVPPKGGKRPSKIRKPLASPSEAKNGHTESAHHESPAKINFLTSLFVTEAMSVAGHILGQVLTAITDQLLAKAPPIRPANQPGPDPSKTSA